MSLRRLLPAGLLVAFAAALPMWDEPIAAHACSCPDCDAIAEAPLVVRGTVIGWEYARDATGEPVEAVVPVESYARQEDYPRQRTILLTLTVQSVFKGDAPTHVVVESQLYDRYTRAEGSPPYGHWEWPGAAGACFQVESDPTGKDMLFTLIHASAPGRYKFHAGPWPYTSEAVKVFADVHPELGAPRPPSAGNSEAAPEAEPNGANDWMFLSAIGAGFLLITLVLLLSGPRREPRPPKKEDD